MNTRVAVLQAVFTEIAETRMAGLPVCNPRLQVEALGFEPVRQADLRASGLAGPEAAHDGGHWLPPLCLGVLVTPWFMNLVCLPLLRDDRCPPAGQARLLHIGGHALSFLTSHEPELGSFGCCSLFSPMQDFASAAAARATAMAVLEALRRPAGAPQDGAALPAGLPTPVAPQSAAAQADSQPSRRGFLFGRSANLGATA